MTRRGRRLPLTERLFRRFVHKYYGRYLITDLQLVAKRQTVRYILANMSDAIICDDRWRLLEFAFRRAPADGLCLEFGVEKGRSLRMLAELAGRTVHGFDSFLGLPEDWSGTFESKGKFSQRGKLPKLPGNAKLHVGLFEDTLPKFVADVPGQAAFIHIDCDIYSSTKTVFDHLADRISSGCVIVFDEYFNYPNWQQHEYKAFQEFVAQRGIEYEYIGFAAKNGHVAVRIK